jgi:hypothetical protein
VLEPPIKQLSEVQRKRQVTLSTQPVLSRWTAWLEILCQYTIGSALLQPVRNHPYYTASTVVLNDTFVADSWLRMEAGK